MSLKRRNSGSFSVDDDAKPDLSPMIDCVFILLIFFIVTTVFQKPPGVEVNRPEARLGSVLEKNSILLAVTAESKVFYGGQEVGVGGIQNVVRPQLLEDDEMPVIIQADANALRGVVSDVEKQCLEAGVQQNKVTLATR
ncbi:biopolymer transporter ExbD [bacterium]|jgi:biopolymer transport protein ExbD|nr:biopolymer transporter ExbD [bacterium]